MKEGNNTVIGPHYVFGEGKVGIITGKDTNGTPSVCLFNNEEAKAMDVNHSVTGMPEFGSVLQFPNKESINRVIGMLQLFRDKNFGGAQ